jgi:DNA-binding transcriptional LysR family regulator
LNLRFVEAFYWVTTLKSVTLAAEKLHLTQSAMSARISALEDELGAVLLDRRDKQFRLTNAGLRFFDYSQRFLDLQREVKEDLGIAEPSDLQNFSLRIGVIESVLHSWLIDWLSATRKDLPKLEIELTVETTPVLLDHIRRGVLDLVVTALPSGSEGVRSKPLLPMPMVWVGNAALHKKRRYSLPMLVEFEMITFQRASQPHNALLDTLRHNKVQFKRLHTISSISAMVQLVAEGFGIATLPTLAAQRYIKNTGLVGAQNLRVLPCETSLQALPVHLSYRADPTNRSSEKMVKSITDFQAGFSIPRDTPNKYRLARSSRKRDGFAGKLR